MGKDTRELLLQKGMDLVWCVLGGPYNNPKIFPEVIYEKFCSPVGHRSKFEEDFLKKLPPP